MRKVTWQGEDGRQHQSLIRDADLDTQAEFGLRCDPPDISVLDWDKIQIELHNELLSRGLITWEDVQQQQNGVTGAILSVLKKKIVMLYKTGGRNDS